MAFVASDSAAAVTAAEKKLTCKADAHGHTHTTRGLSGGLRGASVY